MKKTNLLLICTATVLLAACGGGGSDAPPAPDPLAAVPDSAIQAATGLVSYLVVLNSAMAELREAIDMSSIAALFTSETTEPELL